MLSIRHRRPGLIKGGRRRGEASRGTARVEDQFSHARGSEVPDPAPRASSNGYRPFFLFASFDLAGFLSEGPQIPAASCESVLPRIFRRMSTSRAGQLSPVASSGRQCKGPWSGAANRISA